MEDQIIRVRRRIPRKRTLGERIKRVIVAPHMSRSKRNQRLAIVAMVLLLGVYLLVWPVVSGILGGGSKDSASTSPAPNNLSKKR